MVGCWIFLTFWVFLLVFLSDCLDGSKECAYMQGVRRRSSTFAASRGPPPHGATALPDLESRPLFSTKLDPLRKLVTTLQKLPWTLPKWSSAVLERGSHWFMRMKLILEPVLESRIHLELVYFQWSQINLILQLLKSRTHITSYSQESYSSFYENFHVTWISDITRHFYNL